MSEEQNVQIAIFQAPIASLMERGLYLKMRNLDHPFNETVPAEYYLPVFNGEIAYSPLPLEGSERRINAILEYVYHIFNTAHPAGYAGRSLSVGDVVKLEGKYYLCAEFGFQQVVFQSSKEHPTPNPTACPLVLPDGTRLQVSVHPELSYPSMNINLIDADGTSSCVCFVEYNLEKASGQELCIGVYCDDRDETVYYSSYFQARENDG